MPNSTVLCAAAFVWVAIMLVLPALTFAAAPTSGGTAPAWTLVGGHIVTRWAKDVSPDKALPEYPRPQMVRADWLNLNGLWDYAIRPVDDPQPAQFDGKILVPFPVESALSGVMKSVTEKQRLWYRRTFTVPAGWAGKKIIMHFGAVDWQAAVAVNGRKVAEHSGGYTGFSCDITDALKKDGPQEVVVSVWDPTDVGDQARGKQVLHPQGIMYTPTTGIWQTVWLEPVPEDGVVRLILNPNVDKAEVQVGVVLWFLPEVSFLRQETTVEITASAGGRVAGRTSETFAAKSVGGVVRLTVPVEKPHLWSPDDPFLYDLEVKLAGADGKVYDRVASYFGMRKIEIGKDDKGITRMLLNGKKPLLQVGPLDQGFWPDGLYTAPTDEALRYDIEMTKKLGFNASRKHVKLEPDRWYWWADRLGLLVWQDMPSAQPHGLEPKKDAAGKAVPPTAADQARLAAAHRQFEAELHEMIVQRRNHPSIIMWVVFNEGWGQYDTEVLTERVKRLDPTRLVNNASGWADKKVGDILDIHSYPVPKAAAPEAARAVVVGEFGGLGLKLDGHTWQKEHWGYKGASDSADLTRQYEELLRVVYGLAESPGISAAIYTQITDVEIECNGLMTYDRAVTKIDVARAAAANRGPAPAK